jgi:heat-inducible transcriptional repressor
MAELSARARQILYACITEFVATGEPVGSRTLSKKHGLDLSAASIRNVLSDLEEWGPRAASPPTARSGSSSTR